MVKEIICYKHFALKLLFAIAVILFFTSNIFSRDKMKPDEIITKHLEAIGALETRTSITTRIVSGEVTCKFLREGGLSIKGRAVLASDGLKHLMGMQFDNPDYPFDRFGFDGQNATIAFIKPGVRSPLGNFFKSFDDVLKYGLLGGTLSTSWPLDDLDGRKVKVSGSSTKKIDGKECYSIELNPKNGSDLTIKLHFDAQNFQHIRTSYERVISARMGLNPDASAAQREQRYTLFEDFSDYRKESGLTLPHSYRIYLATDGRQTGTNEYEWIFTLNQFSFNQKIAPKSFNVEAQ